MGHIGSGKIYDITINHLEMMLGIGAEKKHDLTIDHLNALEMILGIEEIHTSIFKGYIEERSQTSISAKWRVGELDLTDCLVCIGYMWKEWLS
mgnify:CR=1 FL=1